MGPWFVWMGGCAAENERTHVVGEIAQECVGPQPELVPRPEGTLPDATPSGVRPVELAFDEVRNTWRVRLCYEDSVLADGWRPAQTVALVHLSEPSRRSLRLDDLRNTTPREIAETLVAKSDAADPLLRFNVIDVGGCATAVAVSRRSSDGTSWEPVAPIFDRTIDYAGAATFTAALGAFVAAMDLAGVEVALNDKGGSSDRTCVLGSGPRVARDVLAEILACSPFALPAYSLMTVDGHPWVLNLDAAGPAQRPNTDP